MGREEKTARDPTDTRGARARRGRDPDRLHAPDTARPRSRRVAGHRTRPGAAGLPAIRPRAPAHGRPVPVVLTAPHGKRRGCRGPGWRSAVRGGSSRSELTDRPPLPVALQPAPATAGHLRVGRTGPRSSRPHTSNPIGFPKCPRPRAPRGPGPKQRGDTDRPGGQPAPEPEPLSPPPPTARRRRGRAPRSALRLDQTTQTHTHARTPSARARGWQYSPRAASLREG